MNDELKNLSDAELEKRIDYQRTIGAQGRVLYHRYIRERERRNEEAKNKIEDKRFRIAVVRFEEIIKILNSIANKPIRSVIFASLIAVVVGVAINFLTDLYRLLPFFHSANPCTANFH